MIVANAPLDPHARARLIEVQDLLLVAHDADGVAAAVLRLVMILHDEWGVHPAVQLVREAFDLLDNPESIVDLRDWKRAAAPYLRRS